MVLEKVHIWQGNLHDQLYSNPPSLKLSITTTTKCLHSS